MRIYVGGDGGDGGNVRIVVPSDAVGLLMMIEVDATGGMGAPGGIGGRAGVFWIIFFVYFPSHCNQLVLIFCVTNVAYGS